MSIEPHRLQVALHERSYHIIIGSDLLARAQEYILPVLPSPRVIIVTDEHVGQAYAGILKENLRFWGIGADEIRVPSGEGSKSFLAYEKLMNDLLALKPDRKTTLIALGGGVIGDLTGFAASTLLRGVPFIQVPTTLLAQVDSSVGGKTGINATAGKNLIGSFYQPRLVIADQSTLMSLPERQLRAGYAEIIKYGLIVNSGFYHWCLENGGEIVKGNIAALHYAVMQSCRMKAQIVGSDERETDQRALLNFGHTFGHALEAELHYSDRLLHGEAVAIGMVMACRLSAEMGLIGAEVEAELAAHLKSLGLPTSPRDIDFAWNPERIAAHFLSDKKAEYGCLTFIVLDAVGKARVAKEVAPALARDIVASYIKG